MRLNGKIAIVCGATSGIGATVVERSGREGAQVLACDESSFVTGAAPVADGGMRVPATVRGL